MNTMNLQKEIQSINKEIETKDNRINILSMNNKVLQVKPFKLSFTTKNGFNNELANDNNINYNNIKNINSNKDVKKSIITSKYNKKIIQRDTL